MRRRWLAAAAAALVLVGLIGLVARPDGSSPEAHSEASDLSGCDAAASSRRIPEVTAGPTTTLAGVVPTLPAVEVQPAAGRSPLPGFGQATVEVVEPGRVAELCVLLAESDAQRQQGLMGVTDATLGGYDGMLFLYSEDRDPSRGFWMKNTPLPLSIAYLDSAGAVVDRLDMEPCPPETAVCRSYRPSGSYRMVLEVPKGGLDRLGLGEGSSARIRVAD